MSAVKIKNQIIRTLHAAVAEGKIPAGVSFSATLKDRRISVEIDSAPFDVMKPERITVGKYGVTFTLNPFDGPEKDHTPKGVALLASVTEIIKAVCPKGAYAHFSSDCYAAQGIRHLGNQPGAE